MGNTPINNSVTPIPVKRKCYDGIKNFFRRYWGEFTIVLLLGVGLIFFLWKRNYDSSAPISASVWGQFGDFVGGLIGSLIAYISVRLLNRNLQEQIQANIDIRKNNENSRKVFELQQFDKTFTTLVELYREQKIQVGKLSLNEFNLYGCKSDSYKDRVAEAKNKFSEFYASNRLILSSYFRLLYRIMQTIRDAKVDECVKIRYSKIFRCLLSEDELLLLRYNAMSNYGVKMQICINQYNILKHLPFMRLLEFHYDSVSNLSLQYKDLFDNIFLDVRKYLVDAFCQKLVDDKKFEQKYKINNRTFRVIVSWTSEQKSEVKVEISYSLAGTTAANRVVNDESIIKLLEYFMSEIFVYVSFERYQKVEKIKIQADSNTEKRSRNHTIWATVSQTEGYPLVLSQVQLKEPEK